MALAEEAVSVLRREAGSGAVVKSASKMLHTPSPLISPAPLNSGILRDASSRILVGFQLVNLWCSMATPGSGLETVFVKGSNPEPCLPVSNVRAVLYYL